MEYDFNLFYYINMYKKNYKTMISMVLLSMFLTAVFSSIMPTVYISTVTFLSSDVGAGIQGTNSLGKFLGLSNLLQSSSSVDVIISILNSKRMAKDIRDHFNLDKKISFKYKMNIRDITGAMAIDIKGSDPALIEK